MFTNEAFIRATNQAGYPEAALLLLILGHGYLAADLCGPSLEKTFAWLCEDSLLCAGQRVIPHVVTSTCVTKQLEPRPMQLDVSWCIKHSLAQLFHIPRTSRQCSLHSAAQSTGDGDGRYTHD